MVAKALMTSARTKTGRDDWCTPPDVLELVHKVGPIFLDPCWNENAMTVPSMAYCETSARGADVSKTSVYRSDGLSAKWIAPAGAVVYVNCPYSACRAWLRKCEDEWRLHKHNECTIALVPARTDTRAWHEVRPNAVCFWKGRITFVGASAPAPFPSALLCWALGDPLDRFCEVFSSRGMVVRL